MKSCCHNIMLIPASVKMSVVNAFASFLAGGRSALVDPNVTPILMVESLKPTTPILATFTNSKILGRSSSELQVPLALRGRRTDQQLFLATIILNYFHEIVYLQGSPV